MKHTAKKRFGQNFLTDEYVIAQIINLINPQLNDCMVEIGPGLAALTHPLSERVKQLYLIELDRDIVQTLQQTKFANQVIIHAADALNFDYNVERFLSNNISDNNVLNNSTPLNNNRKIRIVGNLPYNISTPLLFHLAKFNNILDMHFMLQKEVVDRICAKPDNGDYGRLSVMLQYRFDCNKLLEVSNKSFTPIPKVESAIIRLKPKPAELWQHIDEKKLNHVVTTAFNQRRKTISNSLKSLFTAETLNKLGINIQKRAENLSVAEYLKLATILSGKP